MSSNVASKQTAKSKKKSKKGKQNDDWPDSDGESAPVPKKSAQKKGKKDKKNAFDSDEGSADDDDRFALKMDSNAEEDEEDAPAAQIATNKKKNKKNKKVVEVIDEPESPIPSEEDMEDEEPLKEIEGNSIAFISSMPILIITIYSISFVCKQMRSPNQWPK